MMPLNGSLLLFLVATFIIPLPNVRGRKYLNNFAGPFWWAGMKSYNCPEKDTRDLWHTISIRFMNVPRSQVEVQRVTATSNITRDYDDSLAVSMKLDAWSNNQWKENAIAQMTFPKYGCSSWRNFLPDFSRQLYGTEPGSKAPCVITKGEYSMVNKPVNWSFSAGVPTFFYGDYRATIKYLDNKIVRMCYVVEYEVRPR